MLAIIHIPMSALASINPKRKKGPWTDVYNKFSEVC